jgi:hypothetical protein
MQACPGPQVAQSDLCASSSAPNQPTGEGGNIVIRQFAQAAFSDREKLPQAADRKPHGEKTLRGEPGNAKHDLLQSEQAQLQGHEEGAGEKSAAESNAAELRRSLLRERAERLDRDLMGVRRDPERGVPSAKQAEEAKQAGEGAAAELRKSVQQERERASRLEQDAATARRALDAQAAAAAKAKEEASRAAAEMKQLLRQEHERANALANELATTRAKVYAYEVQVRKASEEAEQSKNSPSDRRAAELDRSLQQERERSLQLQQDLASVKRELEAQTALATKTNEEATRVKQVADTGAAELKQSLQQEREKAEALARELSTAREKISTQAAQARQAEEQAEDLKKRAVESGGAELRVALQQQGERVEQLEQELASARRDVEAKTGLLAKSNDEGSKLQQAAETGATELKQEHERLEALSRELGTVRAKLSESEARERNATAQADELKKVGSRATLELRTLPQQQWAGATLQHQDVVNESKRQAPITPVVAAAGPITPGLGTEADIKKAGPADRVNPAPAKDASNDSSDGAAVEKLVVRASALLRQGDIGSARIVLERAAESGSGKATFALAETYDPLILPKWGTVGTRADADKARELYAKAQAGGDDRAKERLNALR